VLESEGLLAVCVWDAPMVMLDVATGEEKKQMAKHEGDTVGFAINRGLSVALLRICVSDLIVDAAVSLRVKFSD
jgi:hypothetical protein